MFPIPPNITQARIRIETCNVKLSGEINRVFDAYKTPAAPPTEAPKTNAGKVVKKFEKEYPSIEKFLYE